MSHYEDDEVPVPLKNLLQQNASDGFGPGAENPMAPAYDSNLALQADRAALIASHESYQASRDNDSTFIVSTTYEQGQSLVDRPAGVVPFTYEESVYHLQDWCEGARQYSAGNPEPVIIDTYAYAEKGVPTSRHKITLTAGLDDLKSFIQMCQEILDNRNSVFRGKGRFLIQRLEFRWGAKNISLCLPGIEGEVIRAIQTSMSMDPPSVQWVTWDCSGSMGEYLNHYLAALQLGLADGPVHPVLHLFTVKCKDTYDHDDVGHKFNTGASKPQRVRRYSGGKPPGGGVFGTIAFKGAPGPRQQLNPIASAFQFGGVTMEEPVDDMKTPALAKNKGVDKKVEVGSNTTSEWKKAPIPDWDSLPPAINYNPGGYQAKPTSWTYWQKIGGDPKTHAEFPLGHIPYPEGPNIDHCNYLPGDQLDMKATIATAMKALAQNKKPVMPKISAEEQATLDRINAQIIAETRKEFEAARSFDQEDDDIYIPTANPKWDPNGPKDQLTKNKKVATGLTNMTNVPAKYQTQRVVSDPKPEPMNYVNAYYNRPTQQNTMGAAMTGTGTDTMPGTDSPARFASPRSVQSKPTFPSGGRARPFTPSQMTSFQSLNAASRSGTPTLRYGGNTTSFAMPSSSHFIAPPNTISRSRPSSPGNSMLEQFANLNMSNAQGPSRGYNNQLWVPGFPNQNNSTAQGFGNLPMNYEDLNITHGDTTQPFQYFEFGGDAGEGNGGNGGN